MSKGLEALEKIRKARYMFAVDNQQACDVIEQELKALEIIKRIVKIVDYSERTIANDKLIILQGGEIKTKEEYDLLKEALL